MEEAVGDFEDKDAGVVLMDINLPGISGIEGVRRLKAIKPGMQVIMLTVYEDNEKIFASLRAGATGYLLKRTTSSAILDAVRQVVAGGSPMSPDIARRVVESFKTGEPQIAVEQLSEREEQLLELIAKGKRSKEIAKLLFISPATVHSHLHRIYEKLHVRSRTEAAMKYLDR